MTNNWSEYSTKSMKVIGDYTQLNRCDSYKAKGFGDQESTPGMLVSWITIINSLNGIYKKKGYRDEFVVIKIQFNDSSVGRIRVKRTDNAFCEGNVRCWLH